MAAHGELDGVADQVQQHLAQTQGIKLHPCRHRVLDAAQQLKSLGVRTGLKHVHHFGHDVARAHRYRFEIEFAGFDFGEIENVVDDAKQHLARLAHGLGVMALWNIEICIEQQLGHAEHAVDGCADLVAHIGQELRLGEIGLFSGKLGGAQFIFGIALTFDGLVEFAHA